MRLPRTLPSIRSSPHGFPHSFLDRGKFHLHKRGVYHWYISQSRDGHNGGPALLTFAPYPLSCLQSIMATVDVARTFGALLIGGLFASIMAGTVAVQVIVYFKLYPTDSFRLKLLVLWVWFLDTCHTICIWTSLWNYLIDHFGNTGRIHFIPTTVALTIVFTATLTIFVHLFFAHRIFMLSKRNWALTIPIVVLAFLRLAAASVTTSEMIILHSFPLFKARFRWVFTLGLTLSSTVDVLITGSLFFLLQTSRTSAPDLNAIIDSLIRYAFETGALTCAGTVISLVCWLAMPSNLIFMGLHFVIGKLYANSLLVTLNTRQVLRHARSTSGGGSGEHRGPVKVSGGGRVRSPDPDGFSLGHTGGDSISKVSKSQAVGLIESKPTTTTTDASIDF